MTRDIDVVMARATVLRGELERQLSADFDNDTAANIALLQIMPFEEDALPLELVTEVLARNPRHGLANLVRAYLALYYTMSDADLRSSAHDLEELIAQGVEVGAACLQLGEIRRALDLDAKLLDTADLMRASVAVEPSWSLGHLQLAWAMREEGKVDEARREFNLAIDRLIGGDDMSPLEWSYAACFTGQLLDRAYLERERDELSKA